MTAAPKLETKLPCKMVLTNTEYHAMSPVGSTSLKNVLRSPAHYLHEKEHPSEPTPAMQFGSACHEALLEPNVFQANAIVMPKFEGTGSRAAKEQWLLENHGKRVIKADEHADILGMLKAVQSHKTARALLSGGAAEESYFWQDPDTGIICKCRPDFLRDGHILVDIKTTQNADPSDFTKQIANFKYHLQAAFYLDGVSEVVGQRFDQFIIIAIEKSAPYGISVHLLDEATIDAGRFLYKKALKILKECKIKNQYPGYPDQILTTAIPSWAWPSEE
ncbi:MAG: PD-(D/E)XK nuclease-like domain-containing protein [Bdellovibrionales bacterium]